MHALYARSLEHARAFMQGRAGRHHVVYKDDMIGQNVVANGKCAARIASARECAQPDLRRDVADAA